MEDVRMRRRERRRRRAEREAEGRESGVGSEKTMEGDGGEGAGRLVRRGTYTVLPSRGDGEGAGCERSGNESSGSGKVSCSVGGEAEACETYNVEGRSGEEVRPVPAPRKRRSEGERVSSDTDRDITEIDLDEFRLKSPQADWGAEEGGTSGRSPRTVDSDSTRSELIMAPIPKPRSSIKISQRAECRSPEEAVEAAEEAPNDSASAESERSERSEGRSGEPPQPKELPLAGGLRGEGQSPGEKPRRQRKLIGELFELRGRKGKSKSFSLMRLERKKMPKISSILRELKEEEGKGFPAGAEDDRVDFQIDCPPYAQSAENGQIYVQGKNGFRVMERSEILRSGNEGGKDEGNGGMLEGSAVRTAILLQKFWSRAMICLHGVLAGFGFSHAATVTAIMLHHNYEPHGFIGVYSCLSLKIHYVFYTLTALCIVSCFDRVDIGHMNRRHWQTAWKAPSMWAILCVYVVSFVLTLSNQVTEARFEAHPGANASELWEAESQSDIQVGLLQWYHTVWARDVLVLLAWLMISLTNFSDFLHSHISNMAKYTETKEAERSLHHSAGSKGDYL